MNFGPLNPNTKLWTWPNDFIHITTSTHRLTVKGMLYPSVAVSAFTLQERSIIGCVLLYGCMGYEEESNGLRTVLSM